MCMQLDVGLMCVGLMCGFNVCAFNLCAFNLCAFHLCLQLIVLFFYFFPFFCTIVNAARRSRHQWTCA